MALRIGPETVVSVTIAPHGSVMSVDVSSQHSILDGETEINVIRGVEDVWPLLTAGEKNQARLVFDKAVAKAT